MTAAHTITLGGVLIDIQPITFKGLRRLLPAINRVAASMAIQRLDDAAMDDMGVILAEATGKSLAEIDAMPVSVSELEPAFLAIVDAAGLGGRDQGEALPVASGIGTTSTPTSPPVSDGPGTTSTD